MGPINEAGFQPGWFQRGRIGCAHDWGVESYDTSNEVQILRIKKPRNSDLLPWKAESLVAMLRRRLEGQQKHRTKYYRNGKMVEVASSLRNIVIR
jgi:hypothetical protein